MNAVLIDRLKQLFSYNPDTGLFKRKLSRGNAKKGTVVGRLDTKGYLRVCVDGKDYKLHRLAWLLTYGDWPEDQIDHINGDKTDNWISNFRDCNCSENCSNQHGPRKNNKLGLQGVHQIGHNRFRAKFRSQHLGVFTDIQEAHNSYMEAKIASNTY